MNKLGPVVYKMRYWISSGYRWILTVGTKTYLRRFIVFIFSLPTITSLLALYLAYTANDYTLKNSMNQDIQFENTIEALKSIRSSIDITNKSSSIQLEFARNQIAILDSINETTSKQLGMLTDQITAMTMLTRSLSNLVQQLNRKPFLELLIYENPSEFHHVIGIYSRDTFSLSLALINSGVVKSSNIHLSLYLPKHHDLGIVSSESLIVERDTLSIPKDLYHYNKYVLADKHVASSLLPNQYISDVTVKMKYYANHYPGYPVNIFNEKVVGADELYIIKYSVRDEEYGLYPIRSLLFGYGDISFDERRIISEKVKAANDSVCSVFYRNTH